MKSYGEIKLTKLLKESNVSIKDVADVLGCSDKNIYKRIKHPHNFTIEECVKISNFIGCPIQEIVRCVVKL